MTPCPLSHKDLAQLREFLDDCQQRKIGREKATSEADWAEARFEKAMRDHDAGIADNKAVDGARSYRWMTHRAALALGGHPR